jgi:hypothetical protein
MTMNETRHIDDREIERLRRAFRATQLSQAASVLALGGSLIAKVSSGIVLLKLIAAVLGLSAIVLFFVFHHAQKRLVRELGLSSDEALGLVHSRNRRGR